MRILVIGGYGNFGKRLVHNLLAHYDYQIIIAGRSLNKAQMFQKEMLIEHGKKIDFQCLDVLSSDLNQSFQSLSLDIVVNASGPYQLQSGGRHYAVAKACIETGCHYVDLADSRQFVISFSDTLDQLAKEKKLSLVTGASTVPALTSAFLEHYITQFSSIESLNYGISPGNRTERGVGTIGSILSYTGKPFKTLIDGKPQQIFGWQDLNLHNFGPPLGKRWMGNCDIPDLSLLPEKYPELKTIRFQAGLEVTILHLGLWLLSLISRMGMVKNWDRYTKVLTLMSEWFLSWGSDAGGMFIELQGTGLDQKPKSISWQLIAENRVGPNVPTISAEIIIQKITEGSLPTGAMPCIGLFDLTEFFEIAGRWGIYQKESLKEKKYD